MSALAAFGFVMSVAALSLLIFLAIAIWASEDK